MNMKGFNAKPDISIFFKFSGQARQAVKFSAFSMGTLNFDGDFDCNLCLSLETLNFDGDFDCNLCLSLETLNFDGEFDCNLWRFDWWKFATMCGHRRGRCSCEKVLMCEFDVYRVSHWNPAHDQENTQWFWYDHHCRHVSHPHLRGDSQPLKIRGKLQPSGGRNCIQGHIFEKRNYWFLGNQRPMWSECLHWD